MQGEKWEKWWSDLCRLLPKQKFLSAGGGLKRFLLINLGESRWSGTGASPRFVKKRFRPSEKGFGQQPV
jgi:hypothetical protein